MPPSIPTSSPGRPSLRRRVLLLASFAALTCLPLRARPGADQPWVTVEAEDMLGNGTVLGPAYEPHRVEIESSGQRCVRLAGAGAHLAFTAPAAANTLVVRYSLPDAPAGGGRQTTLVLMVNGTPVRPLRLSSRHAWLYGAYPFSNDPAQGRPRNFYDEVRLTGLQLAPGDRVELRKPDDDGVDCTLDLVDLELAPPPLTAPADALSLAEFDVDATGSRDATEALRRCIAQAQAEHRTVWVPAGTYLITGDIVVPSGVTLQGAGLWHTTFVGDAARYDQPDRRVRFRLTGADVHLADFAIFGQLNYRNDQEPNDGIVGDGCTDSSVRRIWVEHTKAGVWVYNGTRLVIEGCRFRNLLADGVNLCVGTNHSVVENCSARGTGDDCFAIWPAPSDQGYDEHAPQPGHNVIRRCTGRLTFLANGGALYGGANNRIEDCLFTDIGTGCGILISTTFPTADEAAGVDNTFSGETVVRNVRLVRCGGHDHGWAWRGALQFCLHRRSIAGVRVSDVEIRESLSDGITVIAPGREQGQDRLTDTVLSRVTVTETGLGSGSDRGLWIRSDVTGAATLIDARIPRIQNESNAFDLVVKPD